MADINFDCMHCGQNLDAPPELVGVTIACPACSKHITIPEASQTEPIKLPEAPVAPSAPKTPPTPPPRPSPPDPDATVPEEPAPPGEPEKPASSPVAFDSEDEAKGSTVRIELPTEMEEVHRPNRIVTIKRGSMKSMASHGQGFAPKPQKKKGFWARLFGG